MQPASEQPHYLIKYILVGDVGSGKTCILRTLMQVSEHRPVGWSAKYEPTLAVEFNSTHVLRDSHSRRCKLMIWDTAGEQQFRSIYRSYYRGTIVCFVVFNVDSRSSFASVASWVEEVRDNSSPLIRIYLVGNKVDKASTRVIDCSEAQEVVKKFNLMGFFEVSAKTGEGVMKAFESSVQQLICQHEQGNLVLPQQQNRGFRVLATAQRETIGLEKSVDMQGPKKQGCQC